MSKRPAAPRVLLTDRALSDLAEIERFSVAEFGKQTAAKHLAGFESALSLIKQNPGLLVAEPDFHPDLRFYRVAKHLLACDVGPKTIIVLTVCTLAATCQAGWRSWNPKSRRRSSCCASGSSVLKRPHATPTAAAARRPPRR